MEAPNPHRPELDPPSDDERRVFQALVEHGRPLWESLPATSALRHICEEGTRIMRDYLYGGGSSPMLVTLPLVLAFAGG